ncbi:MAG: 4'-phosphopantetheinyl transferase superfamily protein [Leptolyngbya sp. SIO3F4]|nr:4'-phosphopantetheinyl transferase superfamily protein [Leptolyngbya sp. SIO3F4]
MIYASLLKINDFRNVIGNIKPQDFITTIELKTYHEFLFIEDKIRMLAARILLKSMLENFWSTPLDVKALKKDENGKPSLKGLKGLGISHSSEMVAVVIAENNLVGIDLQKVGEMTMNDFDFELNSIEKKNFSALNIEAKKKFLYDTWTMKESVVKADGIGLMGIKHVKLDRINKVAYYNNKQWYFRKTPYFLNYSVALCSDNTSYDVMWYNPKNLIFGQL